ncbi:MAG: DUF5928 domain-containing protein [Rubricella sp.]
MVKIAFILLCHKNPDGVIAQARLLASQGDCVAIHFDRRAPREAYQRIVGALSDNPSITFARRRVRGGWGEWSLVEGTILALRAAIEAWPDATHFYFLSGDCMPIKPRAHIARYLTENPCDFVEHHDFFESDWIKTGLKEDRLHYRHWFNERERKALFYTSLEIQRRLNLRRDVPKGLKIQIGSQWCVLRRSTVERVLDFMARRRDVVRFFRTTWIPDETFFQTLVLHLVPREEVRNRTLTFLAFSDYGLPLVLHDDHYELIRSEDFLFARKVSPNAGRLKAALAERFAEAEERAATSSTAIPLYTYMTKRGRAGRRFAPRFWESGGQIGRGHSVLVVACKKWHVGKRFIRAARAIGGPEALGYVFDEDRDSFPDLGGIESSKEKRGRHRRAFLKLLFEYHDTERLMICLDPSNEDTIRDIASDDCELRVLEIRCRIDDDYMIGHARRVGLMSDDTQATVAAPLVSALHRQFRDESDALRDLRLSQFFTMDEWQETDPNAEAISRFLGLPVDRTRAIAEDRTLFA